LPVGDDVVVVANDDESEDVVGDIDPNSNSKDTQDDTLSSSSSLNTVNALTTRHRGGFSLSTFFLIIIVFHAYLLPNLYHPTLCVCLAICKVEFGGYRLRREMG